MYLYLVLNEFHSEGNDQNKLQRNQPVVLIHLNCKLWQKYLTKFKFKTNNVNIKPSKLNTCGILKTSTPKDVTPKAACLTISASEICKRKPYSDKENVCASEMKI